MKKIRIHIGEIYAASEPTVIQTILGSCVSVCLHDREMGIGGMNHILLPGKAEIGRMDSAARYGVNAMEILINSMMKLGARKRDIRAKIFGGAHIMQTVGLGFSPGQKNIRFVEEFLELENIAVISRDTGGVSTRRVHFHTGTGDVFLKTLPVIHFAAFRREERRYRRRIRNEMDDSTNIELFRQRR